MRAFIRKARLFFKIYILKNGTPVDRFFFANGDSTLRVSYPLTKESVVLDIGGYKGDWAQVIFDEYHCHIHILEPVKEFVTILNNRFSGKPKIKVHPFAIGDRTRSVAISLNDNGSSMHPKETPSNIEKIQVVGVVDFFEIENFTVIDLMKINIEGEEYSLLEKMVEQRLHEKCKNLQIQFHSWIDNSKQLRDQIRKTLSLTHELTYDFPFVWENWKLK